MADDNHYIDEHGWPRYRGDKSKWDSLDKWTTKNEYYARLKEREDKKMTATETANNTQIAAEALFSLWKSGKMKDYPSKHGSSYFYDPITLNVINVNRDVHLALEDKIIAWKNVHGKTKTMKDFDELFERWKKGEIVLSQGDEIFAWFVMDTKTNQRIDVEETLMWMLNDKINAWNAKKKEYRAMFYGKADALSNLADQALLVKDAAKRLEQEALASKENIPDKASEVFEMWKSGKVGTMYGGTNSLEWNYYDQNYTKLDLNHSTKDKLAKMIADYNMMKEQRWKDEQALKEMKPIASNTIRSEIKRSVTITIDEYMIKNFSEEELGKMLAREVLGKFGK